MKRGTKEKIRRGMGRDRGDHEYGSMAKEEWKERSKRNREKCGWTRSRKVKGKIRRRSGWAEMVIR